MIRTKFDEEPDGLIFRCNRKITLRVAEERAWWVEFIGADDAKIGVETSPQGLVEGGGVGLVFVPELQTKEEEREDQEEERKKKSIVVTLCEVLASA